MTSNYTPLSFSPGIAEAIARDDITFIITGAGGWLGQATLEMLEQALGDAISRRVMAFASSARYMPLRSGRILPYYALRDITRLAPRRCLVFHYAFLTRDKVAGMSLETFIAKNAAISDHVFEATQRFDVTGMFIPSSGAIYRADRSIDDDRGENPYGVMKGRDEQRFFALHESMRLVISRVFNLGGPFINKLDSYALSSIIMDILNERPITLQADKEVWRSYMHVRDVVELAMAMLLSGKPLPSTPFDTAGEETIEIGALAQRVAQALGKPNWPVHRPAIANPENRYIGDGKAIQDLMAQYAVIPSTLDRQIVDTAEYCQSLMS